MGVSVSQGRRRRGDGTARGRSSEAAIRRLSAAQSQCVGQHGQSLRPSNSAARRCYDRARRNRTPPRRKPSQRRPRRCLRLHRPPSGRRLLPARHRAGKQWSKCRFIWASALLLLSALLNVKCKWLLVQTCHLAHVSLWLSVGLSGRCALAKWLIGSACH